MKNLLKTTLYLTVFALAGVLFQISCSNSDNQILSTNSTPIGKIVYTKNVSDYYQIWTCNYDGTNQAQIPINLPANVQFNYWTGFNASSATDHTNVKLSPDGQKVFFATVTNPNQNKYFSMYSCDIFGNNLTEIVIQGANNQPPLVIGGVY